ncbi:hypothetical protein RDI58_017153 [Solanum bulbocastanum]|uniref:Uncharacterized protein n=1 Tax=Solanum bulbocastanum TaxID=147425 RepID=A0AAN8Y8P2_SOLBU
MARKNNDNVIPCVGLVEFFKAPKGYNSGEFVDRRSGREGYREEANYKSTYKVNDKTHGVTTEYETSVKCKKTTTYHNKSNNYKLED